MCVGLWVPFMLTCSMMLFLSLFLLGLCGVCSHVVVLDLSVMLSWYPVLCVHVLLCLR